MKESRKRTECVYVRPEHKEKVRRYVLKLERYDENKIETKEERNKKKKNQKENKKKEERTYLLTREAQKCFSENHQNPTLAEIRNYLVEMGITSYSAEDFFDYYEAAEWKDKSGKTISNWKAKARIWNSYQQRDNVKPKQYEQKQKTKSVKTTSDAKDGVGENGEPPRVESEEPALPRRELVEKMLREKYPVDEAQAEQMEGVVVRAMGDAGGREGSSDRDCEAADRIDTLAADTGDGPVVYWIGRAILARAESLGTRVELYDGRRIVADAESILKLAKGAYRGRLTARIFLDVLNSMKEISSGKLGMEIMLKMKTIK